MVGVTDAGLKVLTAWPMHLRFHPDHLTTAIPVGASLLAIGGLSCDFDAWPVILTIFLAG